jgi:hypothetical protein
MMQILVYLFIRESVCLLTDQSSSFLTHHDRLLHKLTSLSQLGLGPVARPLPFHCVCDLKRVSSLQGHIERHPSVAVWSLDRQDVRFRNSIGVFWAADSPSAVRPQPSPYRSLLSDRSLAISSTGPSERREGGHSRMHSTIMSDVTATTKPPDRAQGSRHPRSRRLMSQSRTRVDGHRIAPLSAEIPSLVALIGRECEEILDESDEILVTSSRHGSVTEW